MLKRFLLLPTICLLASSCSGRAFVAGHPALPGPVTLAPAWTLELDLGGPLSLVPLPTGFAVAASDGRLVAVDGDSGELTWRADLQAPLNGSPVAFHDADAPDQGWLAVPAGDSVHLVESSDGTVRGRVAAGEAGRPPYLSAVARGLVLLEAGGEAVLADPRTGEESWRTPLPSPGAAPAVLCREQLVFGLMDGRLAGLSASGGELLWTKDLDSPAAVRPGCDGRHLYVATRDNHLHALRLHGKSAGRMWKVRTGADPAASPEVVGNHLIFLSKDTYLYGLKKRNGHLLFRIRLNRRPGSPALLDELVLVAGIQATRLDAYRLPKGASAGGFELPEGSRFITSPVVSGDRVALALAPFGVTDRSRLIALALRQGPPQSDEPAPPAAP